MALSTLIVGRRSVAVERRAIAPRRTLLKARVSAARPPFVAPCGPLAADVCRLLRAEPIRFPQELRGDRT